MEGYVKFDAISHRVGLNNNENMPIGMPILFAIGGLMVSPSHNTYNFMYGHDMKSKFNF